MLLGSRAREAVLNKGYDATCPVYGKGRRWSKEAWHSLFFLLVSKGLLQRTDVRAAFPVHRHLLSFAHHSCLDIILNGLIGAALVCVALEADTCGWLTIFLFPPQFLWPG